MIAVYGTVVEPGILDFLFLRILTRSTPKCLVFLLVTRTELLADRFLMSVKLVVEMRSGLSKMETSF